MDIRLAQAKDAPDVVRLMGQLEAFAHGEVGAGLEGRFKYMLTLTHCHLCVAEDDDQVIGLISAAVRPTLWHPGPVAVIDELIVDQTARGQGVGKALINAVVTWARKRGASEIEVSTEKDNEAAQSYYRDRGFDHESVLLEMEWHR
ncbi:MAG: Aminoalkylphosphonate N-acetyltransferase [Anaerolineales bacterium]|nr:Aminoalkylphosphonate N-acetyltransferase [Anaerolineales bacterium]